MRSLYISLFLLSILALGAFSEQEVPMKAENVKWQKVESQNPKIRQRRWGGYYGGWGMPYGGGWGMRRRMMMGGWGMPFGGFGGPMMWGR